MAKSYKELMNTIDTFIFDIDGVLTDGTVHVSPTGEMLREMHIRDGFAMKAALESGVPQRDIVLGYRAPVVRPDTGFAVA